MCTEVATVTIRSAWIVTQTRRSWSAARGDLLRFTRPHAPLSLPSLRHSLPNQIRIPHIRCDGKLIREAALRDQQVRLRQALVPVPQVPWSSSKYTYTSGRR
jgi:hypothetical protein